ncbi:MAG: GNAT family N-acetyltransferase [Cyanobacteria bacterium P01_F01_bin.150]
MLNRIIIEKLDPVIDNKEKLEIIKLQEYVLQQCNNVDYGEADLNKIVDIAREGFQFRPTVSNFIARDQETTVGIISGSIQRRSITALFIHPKYQRKGIATLLIQSLEKEINSVTTTKGCIRLVCPPSAVAFFEKQGFKSIAQNIQSQGKVKVSLMRKYYLKDSTLKILRDDIILKYSYIAYTLISRIFN